jgi:hypothetical protein
MEEDQIHNPSEEQILTNPKDLLPFVEKNQFSHALMGIIWVILAFVGFNIIGGVVGLAGILLTAPDLTNADALMTALTENVDIIFWGNSSGQVLVMAIGTLLFVRLSAIKGKRTEFLRLKLTKNVWPMSLLAVVVVVAVFPTVNFLGWLNSFVPAPEFFSDMQESMLQMIKKFLQSDNALILGLLHIGIVPAISEEIMYRGYVQRSFEKAGGVWAGILISGLIFGAYHLQITNLLPLTFLGILLAYITYLSDSIIPAMFAHFANNGGQVIASSFYPAMLEESITPDTEMPWLLIFASIVATSVILFIMQKLKVSSKE